MIVKKLTKKLRRDTMYRYTYISGKKEGQIGYDKLPSMTKYQSIEQTDDGEIFFENISEPLKLYIFGAGHVSKAVYNQAELLDIRTVVVDDRAEFLTPERFKNATRVCTEDYAATIASFDFKKSDAVVIMTRGHKDDYLALKYTLLKEGEHPDYIGMIGSKTKVAHVYDKLRTIDGISDDVLESVHSPIGLPFDTETPEEIALSILAEIYTFRHPKGMSIVEENTLKALRNEKNFIEVIIIKKNGSGPRNVGSRMIVKEDDVIGTIGGGAVENACILDAREMLKTSKITMQKDYSLESTTAANLGMVCGGHFRVAFVRH